MTPFGDRMRKLRAERGVTLKELAATLQVSAAYLSALEHGQRGKRGQQPRQGETDGADHEHQRPPSSARASHRSADCAGVPVW